MSISDIYIKHQDWEGSCYFINDKIYRYNCKDESGTFNINNNILTIYWEKWDSDIFLSFDNNCYYSKELYYKMFNELIFMEKDCIFKIILQYDNNKFLYSIKFNIFS